MKGHADEVMVLDGRVRELDRVGNNAAGVRGAFSARGPDSSVDGVPVGKCPDDGQMEERFSSRFW